MRGSIKIELLAYSTHSPTGSPSASRGRLGLTHLAFSVDDIDATASRLVTNGGTILDETDVLVGIRLLFVADPDGNRVELMSRT